MSDPGPRRWPGSAAFRGAAVASVACAFLYCGFFGATFHGGWSQATEVGIALLAGALGLVLIGSLHALSVQIGRNLPRWFVGDFFNALGSLFHAIPIPSSATIVASLLMSFSVNLFWYKYPLSFAFLAGPILFGLQAFLGAGLGIILSGKWKGNRWPKKWGLFLSVFLLVFLDFQMILWLTSPGYPAEERTPFVLPMMPRLNIVDPALPGPYLTGMLFYGSGRDRRRPEYGSKVKIVTEPVDASVILKKYEGMKAKARNWYWGFDVKHFPVNGRVWFPQGPGPFPLVLIVHGNHEMTEYSDPGYAYLAKLLASQGFISVSVDENFLNSGFYGGIPGEKSENACRGWMLLQHLKAWKSFNETSGNPFYHRVDMERIGLVGHSRGGEAVAHAASMNRLPCFADDGNLALNDGFAIRTVVAIAPVDGQFRPSEKPLPLENVNYFTLQGSHDADMGEFHGLRQYQRVRFSGPDEWCKAALYVYRANHGQFNTVWGRKDAPPPISWLLNRRPLLSAGEQMKIAKVYVSGFLQATLLGKKEYLPMFRDWRCIRDLLPKTMYLSRYEDSSTLKVADFEEDINLQSGTFPGTAMAGKGLAVWQETLLHFRTGASQENHAVKLGWRWNESGGKAPATKPMFVVKLPVFSPQQSLSEGMALSIGIADTGETPLEEKKEKKLPLNFTLELVDATNVCSRLPLSAFYTLPLPLKTRMTKWPMMEAAVYKNASEPILASYDFPLRAFRSANPLFQPDKLVEVRFVFDLSPTGMIYLDDIAFRR